MTLSLDKQGGPHTNDTAILPKREGRTPNYPFAMTKSAIGSRAYGAAAVVIGLDGLAIGQSAPLLPFGSGLSLIAAGMVMVCGSALSPVAARLAALIYAVWAIVLELPLIATDPANGSVWIGFAGLMTLAAIGQRLNGGKAAADAHDARQRTAGWRPRLAHLSPTDLSAAKG